MSALQLPPDCEKMRNFLFDMPVPFSMHAEVFEAYWPLVDNVWSRYDEFNVVGKIDRIPYDSIRFVCRFARKGDDGGPPPTKRKRREGGTCSCRVKAKKYHGIDGIPDHYRFEHSSQKECDWEHSHSIDDSDGLKINSFLKAAAAMEAAKGFMPAEVYKTLRSVKILDSFGNPIADALDVCGGKFMTRLHANNAKQSALSATGGKFLANQQALVKSSPSFPQNQSQTPVEMIAPELRSVWPPNLGAMARDRDDHAKIIKNDIRALVDSIAIGKRTEVPRDVLLPLLNSIAAYMDKDSEDMEGKHLLDILLKTQRTAGILPRDYLGHERTPAPPPPSSTLPQMHPNSIYNNYNNWYG
jgi:hypothetical protein